MVFCIFIRQSIFKGLGHGSMGSTEAQSIVTEPMGASETGPTGNTGPRGNSCLSVVKPPGSTLIKIGVLNYIAWTHKDVRVEGLGFEVRVITFSAFKKRITNYSQIKDFKTQMLATTHFVTAYYNPFQHSLNQVKRLLALNTQPTKGACVRQP